MYSTCIFCHGNLGANEAIENFPVGRRLVFDAARGRLWVVCRKCERWNLSPIEERWEAIEECDRLFAETRLRVSTDNIGLARLPEGLELIRIGAPLRPEMAAWRYGDQFGRRRKRYMMYTGAAIAASAGLVILGPVTGIIAGGGVGMWNLVSTGTNLYRSQRIRARLTLPDRAEPVVLRTAQLKKVSLVRQHNDWALQIWFRSSSPLVALSNGRRLQSFKLQTEPELAALLTGQEALQAAAKLLPAINASGANRNEVDEAVRTVGSAPDSSSLFARYAGVRDNPTFFTAGASATHALSNLPKSARLALEMATHEESERRALEGELGLLQEEWQRAEEIASISDDMFISDQTKDRLAALKKPAEG
jgi:hypothetical protein